MKLIVIDLKTNTKVILKNWERFNNINIGHKISVNYIEDNSNKNINGVICSIEHVFYNDNYSPITQDTYIKIY